MVFNRVFFFWGLLQLVDIYNEKNLAVELLILLGKITRND